MNFCNRFFFLKLINERPSAAPESKDSKESKNNIRYKIYKKIEK